MTLTHLNSLNKKLVIQPKLTINTPGDKYEQEADTMADKVMRMSSNEAVRPVTGLIGKSLQRKCAHCEEEEKKKPIMRKAEAGNSGMSVSSSFASSLNASKGGGSSLPQGTRSFMENAFSTDFSKVRIHNNSKASEMNKDINAKAFTTGNDIYFKSGEYIPESGGGKKLLAHELTHVVQQGDGIAAKIQRQESAPASPSACPSTKTVMVDLLTLDGSTRPASADLANANTIFNQCCVRFQTGVVDTVDNAATTSWLGGDTDLARIHSCSHVHAEEDAMRVGATRAFGLSSRYKVFYVASMTPRLNGVNFSPDCSSGNRAPFNRHLYISNSANQRTIAHELAHVSITGLDDHTTHGGTANNLMIPNGRGSELTPAQCAMIFANA